MSRNSHRGHSPSIVDTQGLLECAANRRRGVPRCKEISEGRRTEPFGQTATLVINNEWNMPVLRGCETESFLQVPVAWR